MFFEHEVCLVIAHPDDEVMFFTPFIKSHADHAIKIHVLCLTGKGTIREKELYEACKILEVAGDVACCDLEDSMSANWEIDQACKFIDGFLKTKNVGSLVTFDNKGVSGHKNHIQTSEAVSIWFELNKTNNRSPHRLLMLDSLHFWKKYIGVFSLLYVFFFNAVHPPLSEVAPLVIYRASLRTALRGLFKHSSQLRPCRFLFLVFSTYAYINKFHVITRNQAKLTPLSELEGRTFCSGKVKKRQE